MSKDFYIYKEISKDRIFLIENFIHPDLCKMIVDGVDQMTIPHPSDAGIYVGPSCNNAVEYGSGKKNILGEDSEDTAVSSMLGMINTSIQKIITDFYDEEYVTKTFCYSKMISGGKNTLHYDNNYVSLDGEVKVREHYKNDRSALLYLSDNYNGGELIFPLQGIKIKPSPGNLIFFEGDDTVPHEVSEVISGERHNIICFLSSKKNYFNNISSDPVDEPEAKLTNDIIYRGIENA